MAIGRSWKKTIRKINGKRTAVKIRKTNGKYQIRKLKVRNTTDKTARKQGKKRKKYYYSSTDKGPRKHKISSGFI